MSTTQQVVNILFGSLVGTAIGVFATMCILRTVFGALLLAHLELSGEYAQYLCQIIGSFSGSYWYVVCLSWACHENIAKNFFDVA